MIISLHWQNIFIEGKYFKTTLKAHCSWPNLTLIISFNQYIKPIFLSLLDFHYWIYLSTSSPVQYIKVNLLCVDSLRLKLSWSINTIFHVKVLINSDHFPCKIQINCHNRDQFRPFALYNSSLIQTIFNIKKFWPSSDHLQCLNPDQFRPFTM